MKDWRLSLGSIFDIVSGININIQHKRCLVSNHKMWYKMHFAMILEIALILKPSAECQKAQKIVFLQLMPHFCIVGVKTKLLLGY